MSSQTPSFELDSIVQALHQARQDWRMQQQRAQEVGGRELPSRDALQSIIEGLRGALFPMRLGPPDLRQENEDFYVGHTLGSVLHALYAQIRLELFYQARQMTKTVKTVHDHAAVEASHPHQAQMEHQHGLEQKAVELTRQFAKALPQTRRLLDCDVLAAYEGDPAARSVDEVLLCYPGISAMVHHRIAHELYRLGLPLLARMIAELSHAQTGIDIHPGASIGSGFFIDHGTGVVIGETALIGNKVRLYQAVTLGAKRFPVDDNGQLQKNLPRHPIVQDHVVIYAGATILGRVTIGQGSTIGGNVWLTHDVAPNSHISQASIRSESLVE